MLCSCDSRYGSETVTLRFWNPFSGPDGRTMLALVKRFQVENPDVHVIVQRMHFGTYYNKLFVAGIGGRAPDVFISHRWALPRFVSAGFVRPADDLLGIGDLQLDPDDFDANLLAAGRLGEHQWGVPLDVHPQGMFYNRTMLREIGFVDARGEARPPTNRAEFLDVLRRVKSHYVGVQPQRFGFVYTWLRTNSWTFVSQFDGRLFDGAQATFDDPRNVDALDFCAKLVAEGLAPSPQDFDAWIGFRQGRVAIAFEGIYMLADLQRQKDLEWGAAPLPVIGQKPAAWADSHNLVMRKSLDGAQLGAGKRFIRFLSDHSLDWAEGGQVPVRKSLRKTPRFAAMHAQSEFARQIPYVAYLPPTPFALEYLERFDQAVELALRQTQSSGDALAAADAKVQVVMDRYREKGWWQPAAEGGSR